MRRSSFPEWERKKDYVIRSLFDDLPTLSPVQEEESSPKQPVRYHSPLPPLVIEKEPNRHDEPEEFYQELEIKMRKLYRKLYLNDDSISLDDVAELSRYFVTDYESVYEGDDEFTAIKQSLAVNEKEIEIILKNTVSPYKGIIIKDFVKEEIKQNYNTRKSNTDSPDDETLSEQTSDHYRQVTCEVDVHQEASDSEDPSFSLVYEEEKDCSYNKSPILVSKLCSTTESMKNQRGNCEIEKKGCQSNGSGENTDSNLEVIDLDTLEDEEMSTSIEIVRSQQNRRPSNGSIQLSEHSSQDYSAHVNFGLRHVVRFNSSDEQSSNVDTGIRNLKSFDNEIQLYSHMSDENNNKSLESCLNILISPPPEFKTAKKRSFLSIAEDSNVTSETCALNLGMRHSSFTKSSSKENDRTELSDMSMQTSLQSADLERIGVTSTPKSNERDLRLNRRKKRKLQQVNWTDVKGDFFIGTPKIFKLCPCKDHVCNY